MNDPTPKLKIRPVFRVPVSVDGPIDNVANVIGFRNGGTSTVNLEHGGWTLSPGESLFMGSQTDWNIVELGTLTVTFDQTTGSSNKLQILELIVSPC